MNKILIRDSDAKIQILTFMELQIKGKDEVQ